MRSYAANCWTVADDVHEARGLADLAPDARREVLAAAEDRVVRDGAADRPHVRVTAAAANLPRLEGAIVKAEQRQAALER